MDRGTKLKSVYHRLMLGLSTFDAIGSMGLLLLGPWAVPATAKEFVAGARGTVATCEASGFLLNYFFGSMLYSFFLAIYFVCHIRFEWQQSTIARVVEIPAHIISLPNILGVQGLVDDDFNPLEYLPEFSYYAMYPPPCRDDPQIPCERGVYTYTVEAHTGWIMFGTISTCMVLILCKVRSTELRILRYSTDRDLVLTRESVIQACLYSGAFFLTFFPLTMVELLYHQRRRWYFVIFATMTKFLLQLQGYTCGNNSGNSLMMREVYHFFPESGAL